ncbi:MAG TPA: TrbG/VirB9 family P-type conjugative transfer protein [Caulobacteraceae bacterium]|jgi:type IV secretion system protein VirB9|nr:TrbG/VirB9 family P-type conjugative transfer protein [Caulobacteraceae bacterium]
MMTRALPAALLALTAVSHAAHADSPIRQIQYDPHAVVRVRGCLGFQLTVVFQDGERIENIALGDAKLWQATPNKRSDLLFLKPAVSGGLTNMMVVTDRRRYAFELSARDETACRADRVVYELQFAYPKDAEPLPALAAAEPLALPPLPPPEEPLPAPAARNTAYSFTGVLANVPSTAFDDGRSTYLRWPEGVETPAIYALGPGKTETVLNYHAKGDYLVVDGVSPAYVLRRGSAVAVLYDDAYQQPKLDPDGPRPRAQAAAKRRLLARLFPRDHAPANPETSQ